VQWDHNFGYFLPIPFMRKLNWREIIGVRGVYGTISDANRESMLQVCSIWLLKMCIGSIVPELETSSKCFVSILPGEEII
jgi:aminopeptidase-like protein